MRETVRVSFDVPIDEHTFVKSACVEAHINFRDLMKDVFHKTCSARTGGIVSGAATFTPK